MPPLPEPEEYESPGAFSHDQMRDYAEAYRKAWVASLKPVAIVGLERFPMSSMLVGVTGWVEHPPVRKTIVPMADLSVDEKLYRLDEEQT